MNGMSDHSQTNSSPFVSGSYACRKLLGNSAGANAVFLAAEADPPQILRRFGCGAVYPCGKVCRMLRGGEQHDLGPGWVHFERRPRLTLFHGEETYGVITDEPIELPPMHVSDARHIFLKDDFSIDMAHRYALPIRGSVLVARATFLPDDLTFARDLGRSYVIVKKYTKWDYVSNGELLAVLRPGFSVERNFDFLAFFAEQLPLPDPPAAAEVKKY